MCYDTLTGDIKLFANGLKLEFRENGVYYLADAFGHASRLCSYANSSKMFEFINENDSALNFGSVKEIAQLVCSFTRKPNSTVLIPLD